VQASGANAMVDGLRRHLQCPELSACDGATPGGGQDGNPLILDEFTAHVAV
jgi:hypothetical protein